MTIARIINFGIAVTAALAATVMNLDQLITAEKRL